MEDIELLKQQNQGLRNELAKQHQENNKLMELVANITATANEEERKRIALEGQVAMYKQKENMFWKAFGDFSSAIHSQFSKQG